VSSDCVQRNFMTQAWQRWRVHAELDQILSGREPDDQSTSGLVQRYRRIDEALREHVAETFARIR
jgi:hypothetical protein